MTSIYIFRIIESKLIYKYRFFLIVLFKIDKNLEIYFYYAILVFILLSTL